MSDLISSSPDRRSAARTKVHLGCRLIFGGKEYDAFIKNIASGGAFIWSDFVPPSDADVEIKLETSLLNFPLMLDGKVLRSERKDTEQGYMGVFAVQFKKSSPELATFINRLANPQIL